MSSQIARLAFTIANGQSLSGAVTINSRTPTIIEMPSAWTAASLTFQGSGDNTNFFNIHKDDGTELTVTADAARRIHLTSINIEDHKYLKIRSGPSATPVAQGAERIIYLEVWE